MSRIVLVTNIPAPYRVDLFYYMQTHIKEHEFHVIYTNKSEVNRQWTVDTDKIINTNILDSKIIKVKGKLDERFIHLPRNIGKILNRINPDVVIAWEYNLAAVQSLIWCKLKGKKFIHLTDGTLYSERNIGTIQKVLRRLIITASDAYIASSTKAKEKLEWWGANTNKVFISLLTVDIIPFTKENLSINTNTNKILYVGSFVPRKGLDLLIKALPYIEKDYEVHIVGNGSIEDIERLKQLSYSIGVDKKVKWCGFMTGNQLVNMYASSKVFVLPSREDCFGLVLLEAFCAKLPIVSSKYADGAYDIIIQGKNGFIVDPFDIKNFGKAISMALNDEIMQNAAKNDVEKFKFENVTKGYLRAINSVLQ